MNVARSNKNLIASVIMALMIVMAMMPGMAFAAEGDATTGSISSVTAPTTVSAGNTAVVKADFTANGTAHIDWSIVNPDSSVATINKHQGELTAVSEGTVTVKATLHAGAKEQTGSGTECSGAVLDTKTATVTITAAQAYGFQGEGGNTLKVTDPTDITYISMSSLNGKKLYHNEINTDIVANNNTISFGYTMSAGINNFKEATFNTYKDDIGIYNADGTKVAPITFGGFANRTVTINANVSSLQDGEYTLRFGPSVCGNNVDKNLNCYLDFAFVLVK